MGGVVENSHRFHLGTRVTGAPPHQRRRLLAVLRLVRIENCLLGVATTVVGYASARSGDERSLNEVVIVVIVGLGVAFGNVLNDLVDETGDRIAKAGRPIVSGSISHRQARIAVVGIPLLMLILGALMATRLLPFIVAVLLIATLYSVRLKGVPFVGNVSIGVLAGSTFLFGALARGHPTKTTLVGTILITVAFTCFELAKTIEDADADAAVGLTTAAHLLGHTGQRRAILAAAVAHLAAAIGLGMAFRPGLAYWLVLTPVLPLVAYGVAARRTPPERHPIQPFIRVSKALWCVGLLGLLSTHTGFR
jgi:4-hydroxybenzoate polyprenyltransferase